MAGSCVGVVLAGVLYLGQKVQLLLPTGAFPLYCPMLYIGGIFVYAVGFI